MPSSNSNPNLNDPSEPDPNSKGDALFEIAVILVIWTIFTAVLLWQLCTILQGFCQ